MLLDYFRFAHMSMTRVHDQVIDLLCDKVESDQTMVSPPFEIFSKHVRLVCIVKDGKMRTGFSPTVEEPGITFNVMTEKELLRSDGFYTLPKDCGRLWVRVRMPDAPNLPEVRLTKFDCKLDCKSQAALVEFCGVALVETKVLRMDPTECVVALDLLPDKWAYMGKPFKFNGCDMRLVLTQNYNDPSDFKLELLHSGPNVKIQCAWSKSSFVVKVKIV